MGNSTYYSYITKLKVLGIPFSNNIIADTKDTRVVEVRIHSKSKSKSEGNDIVKQARYFIIHKNTREVEEIAENCQNIIREQTNSIKHTELENVIIAYNTKGADTHVLGSIRMDEIVYDRLYNVIDTVIIESSYSRYLEDELPPTIYSITKINGACDINCAQQLNLISTYTTHMQSIENIEHPEHLELLQYDSKRYKKINDSKSTIEINLADCLGTGGIYDYVYSIINKDTNEIKLLHKMCGREDNTDITDLKCHTNYTKSKLTVAISDIINKGDIIIGIIDNEDTQYSQFFELSIFNMQIVKNELKDNIQILTITGDTIEWITNKDNPDNKHYIVKVQYNLWADYNTSKVYMNGYILDKEYTDRDIVEWGWE